jgi:hypothetical protein
MPYHFKDNEKQRSLLFSRDRIFKTRKPAARNNNSTLGLLVLLNGICQFVRHFVK